MALSRSRAKRNARCLQCYGKVEPDPEKFISLIFTDLDTGALKLTKQELTHHFNRLLKQARAIHIKTGSPKPKDPITQLQNMFDLTQEETDVFCLLCCISEVATMRDFFEICSLGDSMSMMSVATNVNLRKVKTILRRTGKLFVRGIISGRAVPDDMHFSVGFQALEFVSGTNDIPLKDRYIRRDDGRTFPVNSFHVSEQSILVMTSLLTSPKPCHILLYGKAGTGKTEFTRAVIAHTGKKIYFVQNGLPQLEGSHRWREKHLDIQAAVHLVPMDTGVLVMDEADSLLNTRYFVFGKRDSPDKSWLNRFLDESKIKMIWITNDTEFMEESALRRFSYSLRFKSFTCRERKNAWQNLIQRHPLRRFLQPQLIEELSARYRVNAAGVASALNAIRDIVPPNSADDTVVKSTLNELLKRHEEATGHDRAGALNLLTDKYDLSALNLDIDLTRILDSLHRFAKYRQAQGQNANGNINLLFWGLPGTGLRRRSFSIRMSVSSFTMSMSNG